MWTLLSIILRNCFIHLPFLKSPQDFMLHLCAYKGSYCVEKSPSSLYTIPVKLIRRRSLMECHCHTALFGKSYSNDLCKL
jgi:hypothetical protein